MANQKRPWGNCKAPIDKGNGRTVWVQVGVVWQNDNGSLSVEMEAWPLAWHDPAIQKKLVLSPASDRERDR